MSMLGQVTEEAGRDGVDRSRYTQINGSPVEWDYKDRYEPENGILYPIMPIPFRVLLCRKQPPRAYNARNGGRYSCERYTLHLALRATDHDTGKALRSGEHLLVLSLFGRALDPDTFEIIKNQDGKARCRTEFINALTVFEEQNTEAFDVSVPDKYNTYFIPNVCNLKGRILVATTGYNGEYPRHSFVLLSEKGLTGAEIRAGEEKPQAWKAVRDDMLDTQARSIISGELRPQSIIPVELEEVVDRLSGGKGQGQAEVPDDGIPF